MKTKHCSLLVGLLLVTLSLCAAPRVSLSEPTRSPEDAIFETEDLSALWVGLDYTRMERDLSDSYGHKGVLEAGEYYAVAGVDLGRWLTLNVGAGESEAKARPDGGYLDPDFMWTLGARGNLLRYNVSDPTFLISRCVLQLSTAYWDFDASSYGVDFSWNEWRSSLTIRAESFVNDDFGRDKSVFPYSAIFTAGPVYSVINGSGQVALPDSGAMLDDFEEDVALGLLLGVDVYVAHNFSIGWEGLLYEHLTQTVSLGIHF